MSRVGIVFGQVTLDELEAMPQYNMKRVAYTLTPSGPCVHGPDCREYDCAWDTAWCVLWEPRHGWPDLRGSVSAGHKLRPARRIKP